MHMAPWTNTSSSMDEPAEMRSISAKVSSRARLMRRTPKLCQKRALERVGCVTLRAEVYGKMGTPFSGKGEDPRVADDDSVHTNVLQVPEERRECIDVRFSCKGVDGHIQPFPESAGEAGGLGQFFIAEVSGVGPETVVFCPDVHGVCAVEKCYFALFEASRRCKQFGFGSFSPEFNWCFWQVIVSSRDGDVANATWFGVTPSADRRSSLWTCTG